MSKLALSFLAYTLIAIAVQGFFALFEMAAVSFNKARLQYYVTLGKKRAIWLNYLLNRPSRLFGATLIGVNTALQIGSECSRRFYESIHLDPDWAPFTQIILVVIFAELAPLFAARRHPEQVAMFLAPLMILIARILSPVIWAFDSLSRIVHRLMGKSKEIPLFLSREEVRMAFEDKDEDEFNEAVGKIFLLKNLKALELMTPISTIHPAQSNATVGEIRSLLSVHYAPYVPIYHRIPTNIVAIASIRDMLRFDDNMRALDHAKSPWFITQDTSVLQILEQFRRNNQVVAVILNPTGQAIGLLSLDDVLVEIFGEEKKTATDVDDELTFYVERTLDGEMLVSDFNKEFHAEIIHREEETLSDLILRVLEHPPVKGEGLRIGSFIFTVLEPTLIGVRTLSVLSFQE